MKKEIGIFALLVALCVTVSILNPKFLSAYNLGNTAERIGIYGIFSIGLGIVIITGGIDLSVGSMFALLAVILAILVTDHHMNWMLGVLITLVVATGLGCLHGFLIAKVRLQAFIVTLCGLLIYRGAARALTADNTKYFTETAGVLKPLATAKPYGVPNSFTAFILIAVIMYFVLHRSVYGRYLYAVGRNEDAARFSGINSRLVIGSAYAISGLLAGISAILIAFFAASIQASSLGNAYELYGIAAAVLGGCSLRGGEGSIFGIVIGVAVIQVLQNMILLLGIPSQYNDSVIGGVIFVGVLADQLLRERRKRRVVQPATAPATGFPVLPADAAAPSQKNHQ
jgi:ribose transport system permease protein